MVNNDNFDRETQQLLMDLKEVVDRMDLPMLLIGARARMLAFDSQYREGRATKDWDLAVKMESWSRYEQLVEQLTGGEVARFKKTNVIHKFIHKSTRLEVDIIPFGEISDNNQEITWSDGNQMSILGLTEAFAKARIEQIYDFEIRVLDFPALVGLKLIAWHERLENKDLSDIVHVLQHYEDDRSIETFFDEINTEQLDYDTAPSALIGQDMQFIFQDEALNKISEILSRIIK
ncbi:MAG: nucleotidyl transferase AbiEii/AbiGii toxin family protein [Desertifilum sp.]|nr:nucleotidyl transferase AbiEii/AbiGii toxin family protein [Desertifilum sp.]